MKPNKAFLIIATVFLTFALLLGGVYIYVSRTLTPEKMRDLIVVVLNDSFPQAKVDVGNVDFKFGTSIDFVIKQIDVNGVTPLFSIRDAHIRIPIWAILKGGGIVELSVTSPKINWQQSKVGNNWKLAMAGGSPSDSTVNQTVREVHAGLPAFIMASRLNIKMRDSVITYEFSDKERGELLISKFLVKEFGFENPAAFEIDTRLQMKEEYLGTISSHILLIGEADLHRYVADKRFSLVTVATISKTLAPQLAPISIPEFRSELKLEIDSTGLRVGSSKLNFKNSSVAFQIVRTDKELSFNNIQANIITQDILEIAGGTLSLVSAGKSQIDVSGEITERDGVFNPDVKFSLSPGASYALTSNIQSSFVLNGTLKNDKAIFEAQLGFLQGQLDVKGDLDFDRYLNPIVSKSTQFDLQLQGKNFNITSDLLKNFRQDESQAKATTYLFLKRIRDFNSSLRLEVDKSFVASLPLMMSSNLTIDENSNYQSTVEAKIGEGRISLEAKAHIAQGVKGNAKVTSKDVPGKLFTFLLNEEQGSLDGVIDFNLDATLRGMPENHRYRFDLNATKVSLAKINPQQWFSSISSEAFPLMDRTSSFEDENFNSILSKGTLKNKRLNFSEIKIKDIANQYEIQGSGEISFQSNYMSELFLKYSGAKGDVIQEFPLKLVGKGFKLKPDVEYTIRNLNKKRTRNK